MDSAVVSQFPGQTVPLAAAAHPEDDAVQHPPGVGAFAPRTLGRVHIQDHRVNLLQKWSGISQIVARVLSFPIVHPHTFPYPNSCRIPRPISSSAF